VKFGIFLGSSIVAHGAPIVPALVEQVQLMERLGYDVALLGERYQRHDGYLETLTTVSWLLARTSRLRIGSGGFILPTHHPYRLAAQAATLDHASGGRLVFGVVLGYNRGDFAPFGVETRERAGRFEESLEVIRRLWTGRRVTHRGRYWRLDDVFIAPGPVRPSGPPVWVGAKVDGAIRRAASLGDAWLASANDDVGTIRRQVTLYREALAEAGKAGGEVVLMRDGFVAESASAARAALESPLLAKYGEYAQWKSTSSDADRYAPSYADALPRLVAGSPQECAERVGRYAELGVETLLLRCQFPGLAHLDVLRCIERFATGVMPYFPEPGRARDAVSPAGAG
jgi:alkanesulfonate monooxygenase SsuD/methylene tetrahydromethanopterin reductase-like flavin-dependent oxidoreductase (luciferase family)